MTRCMIDADSEFFLGKLLRPVIAGRETFERKAVGQLFEHRALDLHEHGFARESGGDGWPLADLRASSQARGKSFACGMTSLTTPRSSASLADSSWPVMRK